MMKKNKKALKKSIVDSIFKYYKIRGVIKYQMRQLSILTKKERGFEDVPAFCLKNPITMQIWLRMSC
jgi:hypothetical protein